MITNGRRMQWPKEQNGHKIRLQCGISSLAYYRTCIFNSISLAVIGTKWLLNFYWITWFFIFIITWNVLAQWYRTNKGAKNEITNYLRSIVSFTRARAYAHTHTHTQSTCKYRAKYQQNEIFNRKQETKSNSKKSFKQMKIRSKHWIWWHILYGRTGYWPFYLTRQSRNWRCHTIPYHVRHIVEVIETIIF